MEAIYARQSVDKADSISIETQIEDCKKLLEEGASVKIYQDRGYSGKNTERPAFKEMMKDIEDGQVTKVVVWKLDRISRSVADFAQMMDKFKAKGVTFLSCKEPVLNTASSALGEAIFGILMVFAQFERETIQMRVKENYYARGQQGFYLGGRSNYGYKKVETTLHGKKTYKLEVFPEEAAIVQKMYDMYGNDGFSLGEIQKWLHLNGITTKKTTHFRKHLVAQILGNPVYVKADADVYIFLQSKGLNINNGAEDFVGTNGVFLYGATKGGAREKYAEADKNYAVIGLHEGIISSDLWLRVQEKLAHNTNFGSSGTGTKSWLSGLVRCGYCHRAVMFKDGGRPGSKIYTICVGRIEKYCYERKKALTADVLEAIVEKQLLDYMRSLKTKTAKQKVRYEPRINRLKIAVAEKDNQIAEYARQIPLATKAVMDIINKEVERITAEKQELLNEISSLVVMEKTPEYGGYNVDNIIAEWDELDMESRKKIAKVFIKQITVTDDDIGVIFY